MLLTKDGGKIVHLIFDIMQSEKFQLSTSVDYN